MVRVITAAVFLCLMLSCSDITEYDLIMDTISIHVVSGENLEYIGVLDSPPAARSILVEDNRIFFACSDGSLKCYDLDTQELECEALIGVSSPSAYSDMILDSQGSSLYIIGPLGRILQASVSDCSLIDEFSVCISPVRIEITEGFPGYLWVVDGVQNSLHQVIIPGNGDCGSTVFPEVMPIRDLAASIYEDSLLVATAGGCYTVNALSPGAIQKDFIGSYPVPFSSVCSIIGSQNFVAVADVDSIYVGEFWAYSDSLQVNPPSRFFNKHQIHGSLFLTETGTEPGTAFILANGTNVGSTLYRYYTTGDYSSLEETHIPGNPLDLSIASNGLVYILTYE